MKILNLINWFKERNNQKLKITKEAIVSGLKIPENEFEDWFKGLESSGLIYQPAKNEFQLTKENFAEEELRESEDFLHSFIKNIYPSTKLSELSARFINKPLSVNCQITGEQSQKAIKTKTKFECISCGTIISIFNDLESIESIFGTIKSPTRCSCEEKEFRELDSDYTDLSLIYVRDLLDVDNLTAIKKYESKRVYLINKTLPNVKKVRIYGKVVIEPKTNNISIICDDIEPLEDEVATFKLTEDKKRNFKEYFNSKEIQEKIHKQINPDIVGKLRELGKKAIMLQLHSPSKIYDIGRQRVIRGGINLIFYGDSKTGKSETAKDITNKGTFPLGEYGICETGGRTGFLYTIDYEKSALIWGMIPLNDLGLVVLDGLQKMTSSELGEFRETIEQQEVIVRRSQSGEALARTRVSALLNPNKPMNNYLYKCQGLEDTYVFAKTPDLTRFDFFIPFCQKDVSPDEISKRKAETRPIPNDVFIQHIYWAWSRKPEQIIYTNSAKQKVQELSAQLINDFSLESLPIVHNGAREILTRFSVAMACQMNRTDSTHEEVIVETEHVERAYNFYIETLELLELAKYKVDLEGRSELSEGDIVAITKELSDLDWKILSEIKVESKSSTQLADALEKGIRTIKEHYSKLRGFGLIETKIGSGISLSVKGVKFVRWGLQNHSAKVQKKSTNGNKSAGKLHHYTKEISSPPDNPDEDLDITYERPGDNQK